MHTRLFPWICITGSKNSIYIDYTPLPDSIEPGQRIFLNDGALSLTCEVGGDGWVDGVMDRWILLCILLLLFAFPFERMSTYFCVDKLSIYTCIHIRSLRTYIHIRTQSVDTASRIITCIVDNTAILSQVPRETVYACAYLGAFHFAEDMYAYSFESRC